MAKINEVAKAAGVSISTVSYALSGKRTDLAPTPAGASKQAVRELGYSPNAGARMLAGQPHADLRADRAAARTTPTRPTHMAFVLATVVAARRNDYDVLLLHRRAGARPGMRRVAANGLVDAILVLDVAPDDERVALARAISTPTIFIGVPDDNDGLDLRRPRLRGRRRARRRPARRRRPHARSGSSGSPTAATRSPTSRRACAPAFERRAAERGARARRRAPTRRRSARTRAAQLARDRRRAARRAVPPASCCTAPKTRTPPCSPSWPRAGSTCPMTSPSSRSAPSFDTDVVPTAARRRSRSCPEASCDLAVEPRHRSPRRRPARAGPRASSRPSTHAHGSVAARRRDPIRRIRRAAECRGTRSRLAHRSKRFDN